jgi:Ca2+-binding RTX toxin-like protein
MAVITGTNGDETLNGTAGDDTIRGLGGNDVLNGLDGNDRLEGGDGNDQLNGGDGNDVLDGGNGIDTLTGGTGDDRYIVDAGDVVIELAGEGTDIVYARTNYQLTAGAYIELLAAIDGAATTPIELTGNELNNTIQGNAGHNALRGGDGDDYLKGLGGNDILDGGAGSDIMVGGTGDDRYYVDSGDRVYELAGEGTDIVYARTSFALTAGAYVELLAAVDATATDAINLTGNELDNTIQGNAGSNLLLGGDGNDYLKGFGGLDVLDGGAGNDIMYGGTGNDRYYVDSGDRVYEMSGEGSDIVYARTSFTLTAGSEVELLTAVDATATTAINLTGNELNNTIQGNAGMNTLMGAAGDDYLRGFAGVDVLDGGAGHDILEGGADADTFRFSDVSHSPNATPDRIGDFVSGEDVIDLSPIDANTNTPANDAFTFIGTSAFSSTAGELRYDVQVNGVHVYGDVNGDGMADLHIIVSSLTMISASDFIL